MKNAEESRQIAKARRKLKKRLEVIDRQFTDTALQEVVERMNSILEQDVSGSRTGKRASMAIFDQNTHSAQVSQSVNRLREQLIHAFENEQAQPLAGRVSWRPDNRGK